MGPVCWNIPHSSVCRAFWVLSVGTFLTARSAGCFGSCLLEHSSQLGLQGVLGPVCWNIPHSSVCRAFWVLSVETFLTARWVGRPRCAGCLGSCLLKHSSQLGLQGVLGPVSGPDLGGGGGSWIPETPPLLPYACTFSKRNKTKKQPLDPARGPMRPPGPPAETPPLYD